MRSTTVPAQVTTVEDKIVGELNIAQLILLVTPVFIGAAVFIVLPPFFDYATYKVVIIICIAAVFAVLAIRIKERILLQWLVLLTRYTNRPRYHLFDKNDVYARHIPQSDIPEETIEENESKQVETIIRPHLTAADLVRVEQLLVNPQANLHFKTNKKGVLSVHITEIQ